MEVAALELMLAEPENQEMIRHFGGERKPLTADNAVARSIVERYGPDLAMRLGQLQTAQQQVRTQYLRAMDDAMRTPADGVLGATHVPAVSHRGMDGTTPAHWRFDPGEFTRQYAAGNSPAQQAFAHLYGPDALKIKPVWNGAEEGWANRWHLGEHPLDLGGHIFSEGTMSTHIVRPELDRSGRITLTLPNQRHQNWFERANPPGWRESSLGRSVMTDRINPERPPSRLLDPSAVWFDPAEGWTTSRANYKDSWFERVMPMVVGGVASVATMGAASSLMGAATNTVVRGAVMGAVGSATMQLAVTGKLDFGSMLRSALTGGASAALTPMLGLNQLASGASAGEALLHHAGRAGLQGLLQQASGGRFRDGFVNSALSSVAGEVTQHLNVQIDQMQGLSAHESSTLRLLARAAGSALRVAGSGDPAAGFANDFLTGILGDAMQNPATGTRAQGQTQQETAAQAQPDQTPAANSTVTVGRGDTLEQLARTHYGENWRAGLTALVAANPGLRTNRWGSPLITPGQTLNAPSLQGLSTAQLARLGHTGGQIIGRNSQGLNARAQWLAEQQARAAAQQAARQSQGMSQEEAYARYMAGGGRSGSYQRALGEDYRTTWHVDGAQTETGHRSTASIRPSQSGLENVIGAASAYWNRDDVSFSQALEWAWRGGGNDLVSGIGHTVGAGAAAAGAVSLSSTGVGTWGLTALSAQQADAALADYHRFFGTGEARDAESLLTQGLTPMMGREGAAAVNTAIDLTYGFGATGRALRLAEVNRQTAHRLTFDQSLNEVDRHMSYQAGRMLLSNPVGNASYNRILQQGTEVRFVNKPSMREMGLYNPFANRIVINLPRHSSSEELVATIVHEATHQVRNFRGIPTATQYEEYLAFRNELLFSNRGRPSLNERLQVWRAVQELYPHLPRGRNPFGVK
ncbi:MAG: LysM peptidoglycan-binding domain-containing protein [Pseudomonadota bacterium]|nr:LysM peptidoglycan-binding domain-containing protein [Pseudomonadota bacterium]